MTTSLTERYISATITSLPPDAQDDVRAELEGSIADAIEARLDQGEDPDDAEREVLTELGDPAALAAGYADRPLHLLGPRYYLAWKQLLRILLMIVPVCAVVGVALAQVIAGASVGADHRAGGRRRGHRHDASGLLGDAGVRPPRAHGRGHRPRVGRWTNCASRRRRGPDGRTSSLH